MSKFPFANTSADLRTPERNADRQARKAVYVVTCEGNDGTWFELDAKNPNHAQTLAEHQVEVLKCRGCTCWRVTWATGKLAHKPFAHVWE